VVAQGEALGKLKRECQALKERDTVQVIDVALSGLERFNLIVTQGCALGFHIMPFQGIVSHTTQC
jgi:hypothetical protein